MLCLSLRQYIFLIIFDVAPDVVCNKNNGDLKVNIVDSCLNKKSL